MYNIQYTLDVVYNMVDVQIKFRINKTRVRVEYDNSIRHSISNI